LVIIIAVVLLAACTGGEKSGTAGSGQSAGFVFTNGKLYTVDDAEPWAEAVAVKGNKIVYVGDVAGARLGSAKKQSASTWTAR